MADVKLRQKAQVMNESDIQRSVARIAHEILERNKGVENLVVVGMRTRGYHIAKRIAQKISEIEGRDLEVGALDVTFYRDDFRRHAFRCAQAALSLYQAKSGLSAHPGHCRI